MWRSPSSLRSSLPSCCASGRNVGRSAPARPFPTFAVGAALIVGLPLIAFVAAGFPIGIDHPRLQGFNFVGGMRLIPEFLALLIALATYTAAFIAEVVRAGILAVPRGQTEAALALGLRRGQMLRLRGRAAGAARHHPAADQPVSQPDQELLARGRRSAIPDLVAVFAGTTLNQTDQAVEIIAITMAVYLAISLLTSIAMNWYNARIRLSER